MKKRTPLYWRKSDPSRYRFALPNSIWRYGLKPKAFTILCYLSYRQAHGDEMPPTLEQIMRGVHMSREVVKKNLALLRSAGLVTDENVLKIDARKMTGGYFTLPNEVFLLGLSPGAISVYAYLLCCEDRRTRKCHPSYKTICEHTRMSVSTAEKCVAELVDKRLIAVERTTYFRHGLKRTGNNCYTLLPVRSAVDGFYQRQLRQVEVDTARWKMKAVQRKAGERKWVASAHFRPRPPAVRAVFGGREVTSFSGAKRPSDIIPRLALRASGLSPAPNTIFGGYYEQFAE